MRRQTVRSQIRPVKRVNGVVNRSTFKKDASRRFSETIILSFCIDSSPEICQVSVPTNADVTPVLSSVHKIKQNKKNSAIR